MDTLEFHGIEVDQCRVCRGLWLDLGEIDSLLKRAVVPDRLMRNELHREPDPGRCVPEGKRLCPRCGVKLSVIEVESIRLDACVECQGFFCDRGEFAALEAASVRRYQRLRQEPRT